MPKKNVKKGALPSSKMKDAKLRVGKAPRKEVSIQKGKKEETASFNPLVLKIYPT